MCRLPAARPGRRRTSIAETAAPTAERSAPGRRGSLARGASRRLSCSAVHAENAENDQDNGNCIFTRGTRRARRTATATATSTQQQRQQQLQETDAFDPSDHLRIAPRGTRAPRSTSCAEIRRGCGAGDSRATPPSKLSASAWRAAPCHRSERIGWIREDRKHPRSRCSKDTVHSAFKRSPPRSPRSPREPPRPGDVAMPACYTATGVAAAGRGMEGAAGSRRSPTCWRHIA
jgi:hypothetical protein